MSSISLTAALLLLTLVSLMGLTYARQQPRLRSGKLDGVRHGDDSRIVDAIEERRSLMAEGHSVFAPLRCNQDLNETSQCTEWDDMHFDADAKVIIPCGICVTVGCDATAIDTPQGIDVHGRLVFKDYALDCPPSSAALPRVTVTTPFLHVQGELVMRSSRSTSARPDVKLVLTGTTEHALVPHTENDISSKCDSNTGCKVGKKAIAVAGGKLDIQGLPQDCTTWTKLVAAQTATTPTDFSPLPLPTPPTGCSDDTVVSHNWNDLSSNGWNSHYSPGGFDVRTDSDSPYFIALGRSASWQGPMLSLNSYMGCILLDTTYYITVKARLTTPDGSISNCQSSGQGCIKAVLFSEDTDPNGGPNLKTWSVKIHGPSTTHGPSAKLVDGEWFTMFGVTSFTPAEADTSNMVNRRLYFEGPESGVEIALDDFSIDLAPPDQFRFGPSDKTCQNLIPFNRDASTSLGAYSFPFRKSDWSSSLEVKTEALADGSTNDFFALSNRGYYWSNLEKKLETGCIVSGFTYTFSMKLRLHSATPSEVRLFRYREVDGTNKSWKTLKNCGLLSSADGWVDCEVDWTFDKDDELATVFKFYTETDVDALVHYDLDYDDINVAFKSGPVTGLVVKADGINTCWGTGSELLITSHTLNWEDSSTTTLAGITDNGDGSYVLDLEEPYLASDVALAAAGPYSAEIALLSRNLLFEGAQDDPDNPLHGGHLIVYHTPDVGQTIEGLELRKFGQQENLGRYPIHFHMSGSVLGTTVSKNLIRESFQRCFVIHGSHNATLSNNVAYDTQGHCYMLEDGAEMDNTFEYNLGSLTKPAKRIRDEETDDEPSTFWVTNPVNTFRGNVAAGSSGSGFWFEMRTSARSPSSMSHSFNPSQLPLTLFVDNVAHSNFGHGVKTYPGAGYNPPSQGLATFQDTKSYRNRGSGIFFHNSRNIHVEGGFYADNRKGIDIDRAPGCSVNGATLVGYSPEYREVAAASQSWTHCPSAYPLVGVQMHTYWSGGSSNLGTDVTNTEFEHLGEDTGCEGSVGLNVDYYEDKGYFDIRSKVEGLRFDSNTADGKLSLCDSFNAGIDHVAIHDVDGSIMGTPGFIVTDSPRMTTFWPDGTCSSDPETCAAYCPNTCYRTWTAAVSNYVPEGLQLEVTDVNTGKSISLYGSYEIPTEEDMVTLNVEENSKVWRSRHFFAQLPAGGDYSARFVLSGADYWPLYVEHQYDDQPGACGNDFAYFALIMPDGEDCSQLIKNGDMSLGVSGWWSTAGGLLSADESASGQGPALMNEYRSGSWYGLAQYLDTRCLVEGIEFSFTAKVKMYQSDGATPFSCADDTEECPAAYIHSNEGTGEDEHSHTYTWAGGLQGTWQNSEWNEISGDFVISTAQATAHSLYVYMNGPPAGIVVVWDDVSITPKTTETEACTDDTIVDDGFDSGAYMGWNSHYSPGGFEVIDGDSHTPGDEYFLAKGRSASWQGPMKELPFDCITVGKTYTITALARLTKPDGTTSNCEASIGSGSYGTNCLRLTLFTEDLDPSGGPNAKSWSIHGQAFAHDDEEWFSFIHETTFSEDATNTEDLVVRRLFFEGPEPGVDIAIDNFQIKEKKCGGVIMDYGFDAGTYLGWNSNWSPGGFRVSTDNSHTADNAYFIALGRSAGWQGPMRPLPVECIVLGATYIITAKVRLTKPDGTSSNCQELGTNCLKLSFFSEDINNIKRWSNRGRAGQQTDGDWFDFYSTTTFTEQDLDQSVLVARRLYFEGPEPGVEIAIDDFKMEVSVV